MRNVYRFFTIVIVLFFFASGMYATPYWTEQDFLQKQRSSRIAFPTERISLSPRVADNYALLFEYVQICDFLVSMQELDPINPEYGGMHEGETPDLWAIIETDNTQEAIRVWSTYALLSGDLDTYRDNINAAWDYTMNFPAYDEEGSDSDYYRVHNCGWALVAESRYREVYADSSYLWYADSCASYIETHRLPYTGYGGFYNSLHPLVEGWAVGALYSYGIEFNDQAALDHALEVGADVQDWINDDPNRLNSNEVWAMSGGTAMWGVCRSVFAADPSAGQSWIPTVIDYMDTYAGSGEWNNSWNVWYAYAYHAVAAVMNDPAYTGFAFTLVDTLLDADTDNDGGIPATSTDPPTADQSWVSSYLDYMGMETFILNYPNWDAAALDFLMPDTTQPIAQGESYNVTVLVANTGLNPFGNVNAAVSGAFSGSGAAYLDFADVDTVFLGEWIPSQTGPAVMTLTISPGGDIAENDTLTLTVDVLGWGNVSGTVADAETGDPLAATLYFYRAGGSPDVPLFTAVTDSVSGVYSVDAIEGTYRIVVDPEIPYTDREEDGIEVLLGQSSIVDFDLYPAPILLVDDDGGAAYDTFFTAPLTEGGYDAYLWDVSASGPPVDDLSSFNAVVWFTGDELDSALTPAEIAALSDLLNSGGNLLLTGQNIAEGIAGQLFLNDYLGAEFEGSGSGQMQVLGLEGDPVTAGMTLMFPGAGGAGNQTSTDEISPVGSGEAALVYASGAQPVAAVRVEAGFRSLFLAFGLEGVSGAANTTSRLDFLNEVMDWFDVPPTGVFPARKTPQPAGYGMLCLTPNPFNPSVAVRFDILHKQDLNLRIYDICGRLVDAIPLGVLAVGHSQVNYQFDPGQGSGIYLFVLSGDHFSEVTKGVLLK